MKSKFQILFVLMFMLILSAIGQGAENFDSTGVTAKHAFLIQLNENFKFSDFQGSAISFQYQKSSKTAFRFGCEYSIKNEENKNSEAAFVDIEKQKTSDLSGILTINGHCVRYEGKSKVKFYYGIGPTLSITFNKNKLQAKWNQFNGYQTMQKMDTHSFLCGVSVIYGIESRVTEDINLIIEYGQIGEYKMFTSESIRGEKEDATYWAIRSVPIKFGISFKF